MQPLIGPEGDQAMQALLRRRPLLAFDFDGTLAPIVEHPAQARIAPELLPRLRRLNLQFPLAVVSGRRLDDLRPRLGFKPRFVVGNHGAEDEGEPATTRRLTEALADLRAQLQSAQPLLAEAGVSIEDKGPSIALHYRQAVDEARALAAIGALLARHVQPGQVFGGKKVVNVSAPGAPDKAAAVRALVTRCGAGAALFVGDDVNDEPVFAAAPPHWLSVRVGHDGSPTQARFGLADVRQVAQMLDRLLSLG
jgi:trehalose 6-phosphate phosphatase